MANIRKLKVRGLHEHVIEEIGKRIIAGEYPSGVALPGENELCGALGVSRTALREALRVLASKGLVDPRRKVGTVVRPKATWNFLDADILSWLLEGNDSERAIEELYELRHLIEPLAASLAAKHAQEADLHALRSAYEEMQAAGNNGELFAVPDLKFHQAIITASGNRLFSSLAQVIGTALAVNFKLVRRPPRGHPHSVPAHKEVLDAITDRNVPAARVAMQKLVEDSQHEARGVRRNARLRANVPRARASTRRPG